MSYSGLAYYNGKEIQTQFNEFVALPRPSGHGSDANGKFVLSSSVNSIIQGNTITVVYTKTYQSGSFKGRSFKNKELWAWPLTSIISVGYGKSIEKSKIAELAHGMRPTSQAGLILKGTQRMLKFFMDGTEYIFTESDFIRFPAVQASGDHSKLGKYTVSGSCGVDGPLTQVFKFK